MLAYARKVFGIPAKLRRVSDSRPRPQIPTFRVVFPLFIMFLGRFGSLNSLDKTRKKRDWKMLLDGGDLPSADTLGRVATLIDPGDLRGVIVEFYRDLRKNKALPKLGSGLVALAFDGHESTASFLRQCSGCGDRQVGKEGKRRTQYYHRFVFCSLVGKDYHLFLDVEPIRPGEGEVVAARRLYDRVHPLYSRAYDIVVGDALYLEGPFFQDAIARKKDVMAVLKREDLNLFKDAEALFNEIEPVGFKRRGRLNRCWDLEGFTSFPTVESPLRVVKSLETSRVKRQCTGEVEENVTRWIWATTLSAQRAGDEGCRRYRPLSLGHREPGLQRGGERLQDRPRLPP